MLVLRGRNRVALQAALLDTPLIATPFFTSQLEIEVVKR